MFVGMLLASMAFGWWVHGAREWIRQRHEALDRGVVVIAHYYTGSSRKAPGGLWLLGEKGAGSILCWQDDAELAKRLFPEAQIFPGPPTTVEDMPAAN